MKPSTTNTSKITVPLRGVINLRIGGVITGLLFFIIFGAVQWFRLGSSSGDYRLIVYGCLISIIALVIKSLYISFDAKGTSPFVLGMLGIFPFTYDLYLLLFLGYLVLYRGIWGLVDLQNGFSFIPLIRAFFFCLFGWYSYKSFHHLYQIGRLVNARQNEALAFYILKYKLNNGCLVPTDETLLECLSDLPSDSPP